MPGLGGSGIHLLHLTVATAATCTHCRRGDEDEDREDDDDDAEPEVVDSGTWPMIPGGLPSNFPLSRHAFRHRTS